MGTFVASVDYIVAQMFPTKVLKAQNPNGELAVVDGCVFEKMRLIASGEKWK